jgi:hypothetical protein
MAETENLVLVLLRDMRAEIADIRENMATKTELADLRSEVHSLRADVASDMVLLEKRLGDRITHLNRAVVEYHSSMIGHGVLYSDVEERVRRIEKHLNLTPSESH